MCDFLAGFLRPDLALDGAGGGGVAAVVPAAVSTAAVFAAVAPAPPPAPVASPPPVLRRERFLDLLDLLLAVALEGVSPPSTLPLLVLRLRLVRADDLLFLLAGDGVRREAVFIASTTWRKQSQKNAQRGGVGAWEFY